MKCKKGSKLIKPNDSCCPICFCEPCPELNYDICTNGFKPAKQININNECCDMIACISDSETDDLTISIPDFITDDENDLKLKSGYHTIASTNLIVLSKFKSFNSGPSIIRQSLSSDKIDDSPEPNEELLLDDDEFYESIETEDFFTGRSFKIIYIVTLICYVIRAFIEKHLLILVNLLDIRLGLELETWTLDIPT